MGREGIILGRTSLDDRSHTSVRRNPCPRCRAENLSTAIACVTCGVRMRVERTDRTASTDAINEAWIPAMPVRPVAPRDVRPGSADAPRGSIPPRPDLGR